MKRVLSLLFCILLTVSSLSSIGRGAEEVRAQIDAAEVYLNALSGLTDLSDPSVAVSKFDGPLTAADHSTDLRRVLGHVRVDYFQRLIRRLTEKSEASAENVLMRPEDLCRQGAYVARTALSFHLARVPMRGCISLHSFRETSSPFFIILCFSYRTVLPDGDTVRLFGVGR